MGSRAPAASAQSAPEQKATAGRQYAATARTAAGAASHRLLRGFTGRVLPRGGAPLNRSQQRDCAELAGGACDEPTHARASRVTLHLGCTDADLARAAGLLQSGGIVAFPTETVYGLGARADDPAAVARVFEAKGRVSTNPLIVHVASLSQARALAAPWPEAAERAGAALWPGPLTLVVPVASGAVARAVTAGGPTVGVRIPAHPVARRLLELVGAPVAAPSANRSLALSPTSPEHVRKTLEGRIDALVHGGTCEVGLESTVIDLATEPPRVLRPGGLALADLTPFVPGLVNAAPHDGTNARSSEPARAPGQQAKHYSPSVPLHLAPTHEVEHVVAALSGRVGVLALGARVPPCHAMVTLPPNPAGYGALLFEALHALDDACDAIVVELPPRGAGWEAVHDRLARAAAT